MPIDDRSRYLDLLKRVLTDVIYEPQHEAARTEGRDWPSRGYTMIGLKRLDNVQECVEQVLKERVPGDLVEVGVWRGGATILMRALLEVGGRNTAGRRVWVCDSFQGTGGVPPASRADVEANFQRLGLLDERVCFVEGMFDQTLLAAPIESIAVLRLDGDSYAATQAALNALYAKVAQHGYVIIDDYGAIADCKRAVDEFRAAHKIDAPMSEVDWTGVYWQVAVAPDVPTPPVAEPVPEPVPEPVSEPVGEPA